MSDAHSRRDERRRKAQQNARWRELCALFEQHTVLTASADVPQRAGIRQTISAERSPDGVARVHVEHYHPCEWDSTIAEFEHSFEDFDAALRWIQEVCGVHWSQLQPPREPPGTVR